MKTRTLPAKLTKDELLQKSREIAEKVRELDEVEADKKDHAASFKLKIESIEGEIHRVARILRDGAEDREVEVQERRNDVSRTMETVRVDTGEIVEWRPLTGSELQKPLFPEEIAVIEMIKTDQRRREAV